MPTPKNIVASRRRFCGLLSAVLLAVETRRAVAGTVEDTKPLSAEALHVQAIRLLAQGRRFRVCQSSVLFDSCVSFTQLLQGASDGYQDKQKSWEKDREEARAKDPQGFDEADYERFKPVPPPEREFLTRDDNQPFRLTETQLDSLAIELSGKALLAWESGLALAQTPEEITLACYIQGWGIRVLRQFLETGADSEKLAARLSRLPLKELPTRKTVLSCFKKATEAVPTNPLYWQARGEIGEIPGPLYEEAILRFCDAPYILTGHDRNRATTLEEQEIRRAAVRNAEARRNGRRAIDLIRQGNDAPKYESPRYVDSVPGLLTFAWSYRYPREEDSRGFQRICPLPRIGAFRGLLRQVYGKRRE